MPVDCAQARAALTGRSQRLASHGRAAVLTRARTLASLCRAPNEHVRRQRADLHQRLREIRAAARRRALHEHELTTRRLASVAGKADGVLHDCRRKRPAELQSLALALGAHDPQRTLQRGYALVEGEDGKPIASAARARAEHELRLRFADDAIAVEVVDRLDA